MGGERGRELTPVAQSEVVGGGPYGAGAIAGGDGSRQVTAKETAIAKHQAKHFTKIVSQFVAGAAA